MLWRVTVHDGDEVMRLRIGEDESSDLNVRCEIDTLPLEDEMRGV